jgi:hypothetical protein
MTEMKFTVKRDHPNGTTLKQGEVVVLWEVPSIERLSLLTGIDPEDLLAAPRTGRILLVYRDLVRPTVFSDEQISHGIGRDYFCVVDEEALEPVGY